MTLSPRASSALTRSIFCTSLLVLVQGCGLIKGFGEAEEGADMAPAVQDMFSPDEAGACQQVEDCDTPFDDDCDGAINEGCACGFLDGKGVCGEGTLDDGGVCTSPLYETGEDESQCGDGLDNNCDGVVDDGCPCDFKGIAQGLCAKARVDAQGVCDAPALYVLDEVDTCDGEDNDCDGLVDEGCGCAYKEFDEGVCAQGELEDDGSCGQPEGYLTTEEDDSDSNVHCDGLDNDCDGVVDEGCECAFMELTEGVCAGSTRNMDGTCEQPDTYFATQPGEPEPANLCDGLDNDCDGEIDEGCPTLYTQAVMGDGHMCALTRDGEVECRGRASFNRLVPPAGPFESLTAGDSHTCGLRADGSVACWGRDDLGQSSPPLDRPTNSSPAMEASRAASSSSPMKTECLAGVMSARILMATRSTSRPRPSPGSPSGTPSLARS